MECTKMQNEEKNALAFICQSYETKAMLQEQLRKCFPVQLLTEITVCLAGEDEIPENAKPFTVLSESETETRLKAKAEEVTEITRLSAVILSSVHQLNQRNEIASRNRLYWYLRDNGCQISEYRLRTLIPQLTEQGLLSSRHGKYGLSLTDKGLMILERQGR
ncbi:hypothetical protein ACPW7J_00835 [Ihubacter sp. rT4E-8]|uniref:hypothetical protein n=1 Tax=unclassified Ihubacter TaxID=2633299 RepID=UPI00137A56F0